MLPRSNPQAATATTMPDMARDEVDALQASCREISAQGGETGEIAHRILRASMELDALTSKADAFLGRYR